MRVSWSHDSVILAYKLWMLSDPCSSFWVPNSSCYFLAELVWVDKETNICGLLLVVWIWIVLAIEGSTVFSIHEYIFSVPDSCISNCGQFHDFIRYFNFSRYSFSQFQPLWDDFALDETIGHNWSHPSAQQVFEFVPLIGYWNGPTGLRCRKCHKINVLATVFWGPVKANAHQMTDQRGEA